MNNNQEQPLINDEGLNANAEPHQPAIHAHTFERILENKKSYQEHESNAFRTLRTQNQPSAGTYYFNFLFVDSQNSENYSHSTESWENFLSAILNVGWSAKDGPYDYLRQARANTDDKKLKRIYDTWKKKNGVIVIQLFPDCAGKKEVESRAAAMEIASGIERAHSYEAPIPENTNRNEYLNKLGSFLLYRAFCELLHKKADLIFLETALPKRKLWILPSNSKCKRVHFKPTEINNSLLRGRHTPGFENWDNYGKIKDNNIQNEELERAAFDEFKKLEQYNCGKNSLKFLNYLLIDPRQYNNKYLTLSAQWQCFLSAIFYIGKGQSGRPYNEHFQKAANTLRQERNDEEISRKSQRIVEIWETTKKDVIILRLFLDRFEEEALTRQALLIDSIGLGNLCQNKCGSYYGKSATWSFEKKLELGLYLLYQAFNEFLLLNENCELASLDDS